MRQRNGDQREAKPKLALSCDIKISRCTFLTVQHRRLPLHQQPLSYDRGKIQRICIIQKVIASSRQLTKWDLGYILGFQLGNKRNTDV